MTGDNASSYPHSSLSIGIDIEDVGRFEPGETTLVSPNADKVFTPDEHSHCQTMANPAACYAIHWCVKEAGVKALWPWIRLDQRRLSLHHEKPGDYSLLLDGEPPAILGVAVHISVSCSGTTAVAVVAAAPDPNG